MMCIRNKYGASLIHPLGVYHSVCFLRTADTICRKNCLSSMYRGKKPPSYAKVLKHLLCCTWVLKQPFAVSVHESQSPCKWCSKQSPYLLCATESLARAVQPCRDCPRWEIWFCFKMTVLRSGQAPSPAPKRICCSVAHKEGSCPAA